jgi:hypothetical protein
MDKAMFGLCSILFCAIVMAAADENPIAKDQRKLDALFSVRSNLGQSEKKLFFGFVEFDWILMRRVECPDLAHHRKQLLSRESLKASK